MRWVRRPVRDARGGDVIRPAESAATGAGEAEPCVVLARYLPPGRDAQGAPLNPHNWHMVPGERGHWDDKCVRAGEVWLALDAGPKPGEPFPFAPDWPVEILLTADEVVAIEAMGWEARKDSLRVIDF